MLGAMGRPSKGERIAITAKPDLPLATVIRRNADQLGMSYGDYVVALAAHALSMPAHAPRPARSVDALEALEPSAETTPLLPSTVAPVTLMPTAKELRTRIAS